MTDKDKNYNPNSSNDKNINKTGNKNNADFNTAVDVDADKKNDRK